MPLVTIHRWRALVRLATGGSVGWYEAWADGDWSSPDPVPLFDLFMRNRVPLANVARAGGIPKLLLRGWHALRRNDRKGSRRNIADHYDLGNDFYREWLDPSLTYSSGIYGSGDTLEQAQRRKLTAILDRTGTAPGDTILEIGCGWGSFAATASAAGRSVHGLTLSTEQKAEVDARALPGVTVSLTDYRDVTGTYDAVASIEMVEAVGQAYWPAYCDTLARVLKPGGRAAIQYISIADDVFERYASSVDFIQRYVFPVACCCRTAASAPCAKRAASSGPITTPSASIMRRRCATGANGSTMPTRRAACPNGSMPASATCGAIT